MKTGLVAATGKKESTQKAADVKESDGQKKPRARRGRGGRTLQDFVESVCGWELLIQLSHSPTILLGTLYTLDSSTMNMLLTEVDVFEERRGEYVHKQFFEMMFVTGRSIFYFQFPDTLSPHTHMLTWAKRKQKMGGAYKRVMFKPKPKPNEPPIIVNNLN